MGDAVNTVEETGADLTNLGNETMAEVVSDPMVAELTLVMGENMSEGWQIFFDWWPNICAAASLAVCLGSVGANYMQEEEDRSDLQRVFNMPCLTTAAVMLALLASLRFDGDNVSDERITGVGCQIQGVAVCFFQLATALWMTAGFYTCYMHICNPQKEKIPASANAKQAKDNANANDANDANANANDAAAALDALEAAEERVFDAMMLKYHMICWPIAAAFTGGLYLYQELHSGAPVFTFSAVHHTGWCGIGTGQPIASFMLFNFPMLVLMYCMASFYHFCFDKVRYDYTIRVNSAIFIRPGFITLAHSM
jgi:hypothetical protein